MGARLGLALKERDQPMIVTIYTTPYSFRVALYPSGELKEASLSIRPFLEPYVDWYFDRRARRMLPGKKYRYYNAKKGQVYLPLYDLDRFCQYLSERNVRYIIIDLPLSRGVDVSIPLKEGVAARPGRQEQALEHLLNVNTPLKGVALQTGVGKTALALLYASIRGKRTIIGCQGLTEQWEEAIYTFTELTPEDVFVVKGGASVAKLLSQIDKKIFPKIIIYSIGTLRAYCLDADAYENYPDFDLFCDLVGAGIRFTDEAHLNFHINLMFDLRLQVSELIVLTATFDVTNQTVKKIFDHHYPASIRFGERMYKKYVNVTAVGFRSGIDDIPTYAYSGRDGYSHVSLEKWLLKRTGKLNWIIRTIYLPIINEHFINRKRPGQKLLVLCEKVEMCNFLVERFRKEYPDLVSNVYVAETDDDVLAFSDIIVSTPKSAGTGRDIKKLRTVLVTSSIRSAPLNTQILGRLRELDEGDGVPELIYTFNKSIQKQVDHHEARRQIFEPKAAKYLVRDLHP